MNNNDPEILHLILATNYEITLCGITTHLAQPPNYAPYLVSILPAAICERCAFSIQAIR